MPKVYLANEPSCEFKFTTGLFILAPQFNLLTFELKTNPHLHHRRVWIAMELATPGIVWAGRLIASINGITQFDIPWELPFNAAAANAGDLCFSQLRDIGGGGTPYPGSLFMDFPFGGLTAANSAVFEFICTCDRIRLVPNLRTNAAGANPFTYGLGAFSQTIW